MEQILNIFENKLNVLFPFHFFIDKDLVVKSCGKSLDKIMPECLDSSFNDLFNIKRPKIEIVSFEALNHLSNSVVILRSKTKSNLIFRGQFLLFEETQSILFAGTPWVTSYEELAHHNLVLSDFAIHNTIPDLIQIMKSNEMVMEDIKHLVNSLEQQKQKLNSTSTRLTALIQNMHSGILLEDENRKLVLINQTFCDIFGITVPPEKLIGSDCKASAEQSKSLFVEPDSFVNRLEEVLQEKKSVKNEILYLADGRILERDFIPVYVGEIYQGHLWQYRDVTVEINAQERIKASEEKYKGILENFDLGLIEVDKNEVINKAYPRFSILTGYSQQELLGLKATELLFDQEDVMILEEQNILREKGLPSVYEVRIKTKSGEHKWVMISGAPIFDIKKNVIGSIGIHWDITLLKQKENELKIAKEAAEKSALIKQQFLANMSHEIRTPINVILGLSDLLGDTKLSENQLRDLETIKTSANHLLFIINDILDISKIESGKIELRKDSFDLMTLIDNLNKQFKPLADRKQINFSFEISPHIPKYIIGDEYRLQQILNNLISNAIKFTTNGSVNVSIRPIRQQLNKCTLQFNIVDTGIGIAKKDHAKIFENFIQASNNNNRQYGGTGLGLSIVKELVALYKGSISFNSEFNEGTSFIVEIPFEVSEINNVTSNNTVDNGEQALLLNKKVLLVEDNELNRVVAIRYLEKWSAEYDIAENGVVAVELACTNSYDSILMDIQMPQMDGYHATNLIRHLDKSLNKQTPIIGLTAHAVTGEKEKCINAGMSDYLAKPFKPKDLWWKLTSAINEREKNRKLFYNLNYLNEIAAGNPDFLKQSLYVFLNETPKIVNDLKQAFLNKNLVDFKFLVHKIKANFHIIGAHETFNKIDSISNKFNQSLDSDFEEIESDVNSICINLKTELNKL